MKTFLKTISTQNKNKFTKTINKKTWFKIKESFNKEIGILKPEEFEDFSKNDSIIQNIN